jgi:hypothetical protein
MQRLVEVGVYTPHRTHPMGEAPAAAAAAATLTATGETAATAAAAGETAAASAGGEGLASAGADGPAASSVSSVSRWLKGSSSRAAAGAHHHPQLLLQQQQQQVKCAGPVKAIVFSQFWMHVQLIAAELSARGVHHFVLKSDMAARDKQAAVMAFRATPSNCCLLMDASGGSAGVLFVVGCHMPERYPSGRLHLCLLSVGPLRGYACVEHSPLRIASSSTKRDTANTGCITLMCVEHSPLKIASPSMK